MNKKIILTIIVAVVIVAGIGGYFVLSDSGAETASAKCTAIASVFTVDDKTLEEKLTDMYAGTIVESDTVAAEEYTQELVESGEMNGDVENEEIEDMDAQMYAIQNVNLREGTAVTTTALRTIQFSEQVHVTGISTNKQWYRVEDTDKGTGYVASSYLSDTKPTQNNSEAQKENPSGSEDMTSSNPAPQPSDGGGLSPQAQSDLDKIKAQLGGGGSFADSPTGSSAGDAPSGPAWEMAQ